MKNDKLKIGIDGIKNISMTTDEKSRIFENVINTTPISIETKVNPSPFYSFISIITTHSKLAYYIVVPLIIILSSGGAVFASENSLPDSILYPLKVKVVEPLEGAFKFSNKEKAKHESDLASKRLVEAEVLAKNGKLDSFQEEKINRLLIKHTKALNNALAKKSEPKDVEEIDEIITNFRAEMNAHAKVLDVITQKNLDSSKEDKNDDAKENKIKNTRISNNARVGADNMKEVQRKKEREDGDKFIKRKEAVQSLIDVTDKNLEKIKEENQSEQNMTDDTSEKVNEAKKYLDEAKKKEMEGDNDEAYSSLLDSESSIREANILFKTGQKLKNIDNVNNKIKYRNLENDNED